MGEFLIIMTNAEVPLWGHFNSLRRHASSPFSANGLLSTKRYKFRCVHFRERLQPVGASPQRRRLTTKDEVRRGG